MGSPRNGKESLLGFRIAGEEITEYLQTHRIIIIIIIIAERVPGCAAGKRRRSSHRRPEERRVAARYEAGSRPGVGRDGSEVRTQHLFRTRTLQISMRK
jgi:hypothetical protein